MVAAVEGVLANCLEEDFEPSEIRVGGGFQPEPALLSVVVEAPASKAYDEALLEVFHDIFYELPELDPETVYDFTWKTPESETKLQTHLEALPETGELSREDWEYFVENLVYTRNGEALEMVGPGDFIDDD